MFELLVIIVCCWLFFIACKLMFKIAWGATNVIAVVVSVLAFPVLAIGVLIASGMFLLIPVAMLVLAIILLKNLT